MLFVNSTEGTKELLIKFNITSVPNGQQIDDATLYLRMDLEGIDAGEEYHADVHHLYNQTWIETYPTWNNQASLGSYNTTYEDRWTVTGPDPDPDAPNWVNWTVTNMVAKDYGDSNDNCSIWLQCVLSSGSPTSTDDLDFRSKEYVTLSRWMPSYVRTGAWLAPLQASSPPVISIIVFPPTWLSLSSI